MTGKEGKGIASLKEGEEIREEDDDQSGDQFAISHDTQSICNNRADKCLDRCVRTIFTFQFF